MMIKEEDHNTGVSDGIKKFFMKDFIENLKNSALSKNLIKSIKKYFIRSLIKNLKNGALSRDLIKCIKKYLIKNLSRILKKCLIMSKKVPYQEAKNALS